MVVGRRRVAAASVATAYALHVYALCRLPSFHPLPTAHPSSFYLSFFCPIPSRPNHPGHAPISQPFLSSSVFLCFPSIYLHPAFSPATRKARVYPCTRILLAGVGSALSAPPHILHPPTPLHPSAALFSRDSATRTRSPRPTISLSRSTHESSVFSTPFEIPHPL